jgi:hypothetical protein
VNSLDKALLAAATRLTDRDRYLCRLLADHDVLTTRQLCQVAFSGERRTSQRLAQLAGLGVLESVRPRSVTAAVPQHWLLGPIGVHVAAAELGVTVQVATRRRESARHLLLGQQLTHRVGTNGIFTALLAASRTPTPAGWLEEWWPARRCAAEYAPHIRPDGYGVWTTPSRRVPFLLEYDTGTERLLRLAAKLDGYANLADAAGHPDWILFTFPATGREGHARRVLGVAAAALQLPVATATITPGERDGPAGPIWQPTGSLHRYALHTLPAATTVAAADAGAVNGMSR